MGVDSRSPSFKAQAQVPPAKPWRPKRQQKGTKPRTLKPARPPKASYNSAARLGSCLKAK
eukprot:1244872-Amphidinium_carterae.1